MKNSKENIISLIIINTGGTFNKEYNEILGVLEVRQDNLFIEKILSDSKIEIEKLTGILYKDSLDITDLDRELLCLEIEKIDSDKILIIHGTDTMDKTAEYLDRKIENKTIVLTGAMKPYSIDPVEAVSNLMMGIGYLIGSCKDGVYIAMHGNVKEHMNIKKNKQKGIFECLK